MLSILSDGVYEMREKFGPGWRMYYLIRGKTIIVMMGGGDKSSQSNDIKGAKKIAKLLED
jgi:putative addiction module killer protein